MFKLCIILFLSSMLQMSLAHRWWLMQALLFKFIWSDKSTLLNHFTISNENAESNQSTICLEHLMYCALGMMVFLIYCTPSCYSCLIWIVRALFFMVIIAIPRAEYVHVCCMNPSYSLNHSVLCSRLFLQILKDIPRMTSLAHLFQQTVVQEVSIASACLSRDPWPLVFSVCILISLTLLSTYEVNIDSCP